MSTIVGKDTRVLVQGITGNVGRFHTEAMLGYGTKIVAGVTPGKGGQELCGVPVYDSVAEAVNKQGANASVVYVPPRFAPAAIIEAIDAGLKTLVVITDLIPQKDSIEFVARANANGVTVVGPNCPGIINPVNRVHMGVMPGHVFQPGNIGMISRSGTLTYEIAWLISSAGLGQSTCVGIGGDPIIGLDFIRVLDIMKNDEETGAVVLIGEIGGNLEEKAAEYIGSSGYAKPVVAYVAGRTAPPEKRMGHAGAIVSGTMGTAKSKIDAFSANGIPVAEKPSDIPRLLERQTGSTR
jgi:succinyl-CoA synthetase alpha subunit